MDFRTTTLPSHHIICPTGPRLDAMQALQFKEMFRDVIINTDRSIIVDLSQIDFIDSSGLGALVTTAKLISAPYKVKFSNLQSLVERVFRLTHIDRVFEIVQDPNDWESNVA